MQQEHNKQRSGSFTEIATQINAWLEHPKMYVLNLEKERKIYEVQQKIQAILDEEDITAEVRIKPCPLGMGDVIIEFECESFIIRNIQEFQSVINEMSNFEIYPTSVGVKFAGVISNVAKAVLL